MRGTRIEVYRRSYDSGSGPFVVRGSRPTPTRMTTRSVGFDLEEHRLQTYHDRRAVDCMPRAETVHIGIHGTDVRKRFFALGAPCRAIQNISLLQIARPEF